MDVTESLNDPLDLFLFILSGGFVGWDKSIYCIPENSDKVMKVDPSRNKEEPIITYL